MRFLILSKADIQGNLNLNALLPLLTPSHEVHVLLSDLMLPAERGHLLADRIAYHDRDFILETFFPILDQMAVTPERMRNRPALLTFKGLSRAYNVPVTVIPHLKRAAHLEKEVRTFAPHVLFCCRHDYIISDAIVQSAERGAYNTHSGRLPVCCGPQAPFWAMHQANAYTACTLHHMTSRIDGGDIVAAPVVKLEYDHSLFWNRMRIYEAGMAAFAALLPRLEKGVLPGKAQDQTKRAYYKVPGQTELEEFEARGHELVMRTEYEEVLQRYLPEGISLKDVGYHPDTGVF